MSTDNGQDESRPFAVCTSLHVFSPKQSPSNLSLGHVPFCPLVHSLSAGFNFALLTDGHQAYSWGYHGEFHRLGLDVPDSYRAEAPTPLHIPGNPKIVQCAAGGNHSLVLDDNGNVYSFGADDYGQLGRLTTSDLPAPVPLPASAVQVHAGWNFSLALLESCDKIMTWGSGKDGQLGHGYFPERTLPEEVSLPGRVDAISVGYSHVAAIITDTRRRVVTWGSDGLSVTKPHQIRDVPRLPAEDVVQVAAGKLFTVFLTGDGTVFTAGRSEEGQLGLGDRFGRNHACVVPALLRHKIVNVAAATVFVAALSEEGGLFVWGAGHDVPFRVSTSGFGLAMRYPFAMNVRIEAWASVAISGGIRPADIDPCFSPLRPLRSFVYNFCEGRFLPELRRTAVRYKCESSEHEQRCNDCAVMAYGPILAAASRSIRALLTASRGKELDLSAYSREAVVQTVKLLSCGVLEPSTSVATAQDVSAIMSRLRAPSFDRIVTAFLSRRLLQRDADTSRDLWDTFDTELEGHEETRMRKLLYQAGRTNAVRVIVDCDDGDSFLVGTVDLLAASTYSEAFRSWLQDTICDDGRSSSLTWAVRLRGDSVSSIAIEAVRQWVQGKPLKLPQNLDTDTAVRHWGGIMRIAHCLDMSLLKDTSERFLVRRAHAEMKLSTWSRMVKMSRDLGYTRARHKLLSIGDNLCTSIHLAFETKRVEEMETEAARVNWCQDVEAARSARRGLETFRRARIYCDWEMNEDEMIENVRDACVKDKRFGPNVDGLLEDASRPTFSGSFRRRNAQPTLLGRIRGGVAHYIRWNFGRFSGIP